MYWRIAMKIRTSVNGYMHWGTSPLPAGAACLGTVETGGVVGALLKTGDGNYHLGKRGKMGAVLDKQRVEYLLERAKDFGAAGSVKSDKKAAASADNGRRGGRPAGSKDSKPRKRKAKDESR
jgi:hypothetical protein